MDQNFYGSVDQVAGRDIINVASNSLWNFESPLLEHELARCNRKLWQMRRDIFFSIPFLWFVTGTLGTAWILLSGLWFRMPNSWWMFVWALIASAAPAVWLAKIRERKGKMVAYYRLRIAIIDTILQDRE